MILATLLLAATTVARPPASGLTADQLQAAQTIVTAVCNRCHEGRKPLSANMLREESPAAKIGHFRKKAKLTEDQIQLMVQYLTAVRDGQAQLPQATGSNAAAPAGDPGPTRKPSPAQRR